MLVFFKRETATGDKETILRVDTKWIIFAVLVVVLIMLGVSASDIVQIVFGLVGR